MQLRSLGVAALAAGALLGGATPALATGGGNDTSSKLRKAVTVDGIRVHQGAFNLAALVTGGNRLAGTKGYDYSADYVALRAKFAGLNVSRQDFEYDLLVLRRLDSRRSSTSSAASATCPRSSARSPASVTSAR